MCVTEAYPIPARGMLVVTIVRDAMLRTMLAEALVRAGVPLFAAKGVRDASCRRRVVSGVLLLDEPAAAGEAGRWIETLWFQRRWRRVIVLTLDVTISAIERCALATDGHSPSETLAELFDDWSRIETRSQGA